MTLSFYHLALCSTIFCSYYYGVSTALNMPELAIKKYFRKSRKLH